MNPIVIGLTIVALLLVISAPHLMKSARTLFAGQYFANQQLVNLDPMGIASFASQDNPFPARYLVAKRGAEATGMDVAGPADYPIGIALDETPSDGDQNYPIAVAIFGATKGTQRAIAYAALNINDRLVVLGGGMVGTLPATVAGGGTAWVVGVAWTAALAQGDEIAMIPCLPYQVTIPAPAGGG